MFCQMIQIIRACRLFAWQILPKVVSLVYVQSRRPQRRHTSDRLVSWWEVPGALVSTSKASSEATSGGQHRHPALREAALPRFNRQSFRGMNTAPPFLCITAATESSQGVRGIDCARELGTVLAAGIGRHSQKSLRNPSLYSPGGDNSLPSLVRRENFALGGYPLRQNPPQDGAQVSKIQIQRSPIEENLHHPPPNAWTETVEEKREFSPGSCPHAI